MKVLANSESLNLVFEIKNKQLVEPLRTVARSAPDGLCIKTFMDLSGDEDIESYFGTVDFIKQWGKDVLNEKISVDCANIVVLNNEPNLEIKAHFTDSVYSDIECAKDYLDKFLTHFCMKSNRIKHCLNCPFAESSGSKYYRCSIDRFKKLNTGEILEIISSSEN